MSLMFSGIGVSRGIAIGEAYILRRDRLEVGTRTLDKGELAGEARRLRRAFKTARTALLATRENIPDDAPGDIGAFIETHILMLDDDLLSTRPLEIIRTERINAEAAMERQREELARVFGSMEDSYLATRVDDVNHVIDTVLRALAGKDQGESRPGGHLWKGRVVVADDLTPADTISMKNQGVAGFVTETGGQLSHTAILARSLGIPAIVGVHDVRRYVRTGEMLTLDGRHGFVLAEPTEEILEDFRARRKEARRRQKELEALVGTEAVTRDGVALTLSANIEVEDDLKAIRRVGAAGVGLYRTEFLYMNRDTVPDEQEHFRVYTKVMRALRGAPLTIRTADLGADKQPGNAAVLSLPAHNPAMGLRGIRLCLNDTSLFVPQLRAILRASARGPVRILLPMLTSLAEVRQTRALIEQVKAALAEEGLEFDPAVPVGGMIEVPAAAIVAGRFAAELDFLSIGTNDLIQYSLAIDRVDDQVNYLYDPLHPAVLELIRGIIDAGREAGVPVSMCGEMAGDPRYVRLLLGLGLTEFSMPPNQLLEVKRCLLESRRATLRKQVQALLEADTPEERDALLERVNAAPRT